MFQNVDTDKNLYKSVIVDGLGTLDLFRVLVKICQF